MTEFMGGEAHRVAAYGASLAALVVLMIGQVLPDPRLTVSSVPLNTVLILLMLIFSVLLVRDVSVICRVVAAFAPLFPLAITLAWSRDGDLGAARYAALMIPSLAAVLLLLFAAGVLGIQETLRMWVFASLGLLVLAVLYKLREGFWDRDVNFLLNGPNVFARQMGLMAIISGLVLSGGWRWVLIVVFFLATVWTQSKGPLIGLLVVGGWYAFARGGLAIRVILLLAASSAVLALVIYQDELRGITALARFFLAADTLVTGSIDGANYGSIGSRVDMYGATTNLIATVPWGVGLGGWMSWMAIDWSEYPHNVFLEILSEGGVLIGSIGLVPFFYFIVSRGRLLFGVCMFLCLCQQVSGSLADARFWLALSILAVCQRLMLSKDDGGRRSLEKVWRLSHVEIRS